MILNQHFYRKTSGLPEQTNTFITKLSYELTNISNVDALYLYPQVTAK